jgi:hypothetical protein
VDGRTLTLSMADDIVPRLIARLEGDGFGAERRRLIKIQLATDSLITECDWLCLNFYAVGQCDMLIWWIGRQVKIWE